MLRFEDLPILTENMFGEVCQQPEYYCMFCERVKGGYCKSCKIEPTDLAARPSKFKLFKNYHNN